MLLNYETIKYFTNEQLELDGYDYSTRQYQVGGVAAAAECTHMLGCT
jgi:ABC-type transport system involved in Fe-S cluster assembly fused permease/ATPase subunit